LLHNTTIHDQNKPAKHLTFMCVWTREQTKFSRKSVLWD